NLPYALETLTKTTLRNIVGDIELDQTLASRDMINAKMREVIEEAAIGWGVDVTRVELQAIEPPRDIQQSMELQMRAERERRAAVFLPAEAIGGMGALGGLREMLRAAPNASVPVDAARPPAGAPPGALRSLLDPNARPTRDTGDR